MFSICSLWLESIAVRRPTQIECLYLDFDGFFASVDRRHGPSCAGPGRRSAVHRHRSSMRDRLLARGEAARRQERHERHDARALCPDIVFVAQSPDLYRRAHNALLSEISAVLPIDAVKSIDELTCRVEPSHRADPAGLGRRIKARIAAGVGHHLLNRLRRQPATCEDGLQGGQEI
jgi:DNA polymerase-4